MSQSFKIVLPEAQFARLQAVADAQGRSVDDVASQMITDLFTNEDFTDQAPQPPHGFP
jgi:hypothetical protein